MKTRILLSALLGLIALSTSALADVTNNAPTTVSGGTVHLAGIQSDDGVTYSVAPGGTLTTGGFSPVTGEISTVVLHVKFTVDSGGYTGTNPITVNGVNTPVIPASGDTARTASIDITGGAFRVDSSPEITALAVTFANNDGGTAQSVRFDYAYLVVIHTPSPFAPPTWSDEFNDSGPPNPDTWTFEQGFVRNEELQWYQPNNAWQENGNLVIEGRREQVPNPNFRANSSDWRINRQYAEYTSSSIVSQNKYSFQYGRMQVRAKIPCFPGSWPAIWTLGNTGEWPSNGECDILEYYATDSVLANVARGTTTRWSAWWDSVKKPVSTFTPNNPAWRYEYHVWTMQWDAQNIRLYIDNHLMNTTAQTSLVNPTTQWGPLEPFKQPHFLLLNLALGGAGGDPSGTAFPIRYEVDHVRVWEGLTDNIAPTDIALSSSSVQEGLPSGTVVGNLGATDVDAAEVHGFSLVAGTGDTHNSSFEVVFHSDQTKTSVLRAKVPLNYADGPTRSVRVRVTDIEQATYDKILTVNVLSSNYYVTYNGNSNTGGSVPVDSNAYTAGATATVLGNTGNLTRSGYIFTGWNTATNSSGTYYAAGSTFSISSNTTLYAQWSIGGVLAVTPTGNLNSTGGYTGPFSPTSLQYTLTNDGNTTLNWTVAKSATWVDLSSTGGTLGVGASTTVTVSINNAANTLNAGIHSDTITFTNTTNGFGNTTRNASLTISRSGQTITFDPLAGVYDDSAPFALNGSASSGLTVSYTSSNPSVATVSGSTVTVVGLGSTTITASQAGNTNYDPATAVPQTLTVVRANPLAATTGPYLILFNQSLTLNGSGSQPSYGETITNHAWDLNNDSTFGDVTGASPAAVSYTDLVTTWGMSEGLNTISLRVTDSAGKASTVSTTVEVVIGLTWDANGATANRTDGGGAWLTASQWWDGTTNQNWSSGSSATFGNGGAGGVVTLASATAVNTLVFNSFTGTYTLGTAGNAITLNGGVIKNTASGAVTIVSPVTLGAAQTWTNSSNTLTMNAAVSNNGHLLSFDGNGTTTFAGSTSSIISGSGGITMNGSGRLFLGAGSAPVHNYTGATTINSGSILISNNLGGGNLTINGGYLDFYFGGTFTRALGSGSGQVHIPGGTSGFSNNGSTGATVRLNNSATYEAVWGSASFNPSTLVLQASNAQNSSTLTFDNKIDLNGANRTIFTSVTTGTGAGSATLSQIVRNSTGTAGLIKTGSGRLNLNAANTYNGGTTLQAGTLQLGNASALGSASGSLTINGGLLNLNDQTVSIGNLTGTGGTIANNGAGARTLTIGSGDGTGGVYQGFIANKTGTGTGTVALTKTGTGTITLSGSNTYTGPTTINGGALVITGSSQATASIAFANNSTLGLVIGSPVTATGAAVNLANGRIAVTGTAGSASHLLLTAASIIGSPVLANAIPGYELVVVGNQLLLNLTGTTDLTPPTLVDITDNAGGSTVSVNTPINYTVTFSEDMDAGTVQTSDFGNAGTASGVINSVTETTPGVFIVSVTPTTSGSLQLRINAGATLTDVAGNALNTAADLVDDTIISVTSPNTAPVAVSQNKTTAEDTGLPITLTATDGQSDPLTYAIVSAPAHGTLSGTPPNVTYTPAADYNGPDGFTFKANDGLLDSAPASVDITVTPVNDAPVAIAQSATTAEDTALPITLTGADAENSALTFTIVAQPASGTLSGTAPNVTYTPAANYNGAASFTFKVNDGTTDSATATVSINVTSVNDAPVFTVNPIIAAGASEGVAYTGQTIAGSATDADAGDSITYIKVSGPAWLSVASNGTLSGTPSLGSAGLNSFVVRATDSTSATADATLQITVAGLPLPWVSSDIGTGMLAGSATHNAGTFTQAGSGIIGSTSDKLRFTYQTLTGDGEIIAKISALQNTGSSSRVGVMIRDTLAANSKQILMGMTGSGSYRWARRTTTGGSTSSTNSSSGTVPNTWVRLVRSGTTITAYKSSNGTTWTTVGSTTSTTFAATCYIGIAVGSGSDSTLNTSQFSNLSVTP